MTDVIAEAKAIREALEPLGWSYLGGGPYPHNPRMNFKRGNEAMVISVVSQEINIPLEEDQADG